MMSFNTTWLMQNGNRQAVAYLAVTYVNDSTTKAFSTISSSGTTTLRIPYCKERVKEIKGYVVCGIRPATDKTNNLCVLFVDNITLAKFRNKIIAEPQVLQRPQIDSARFMKPDSAQYDSLRRPMPHPNNRPLTIGEVNRMRRIKESNKPNN